MGPGIFTYIEWLIFMDIHGKLVGKYTIVPWILWVWF